MNTNQFTGSLAEWIKVVRAELLVEIGRVRELPEFQQWAAKTIAGNIDQPNIPQWDEDDCLMLWVLRAEPPQYTLPPIDAPKWATTTVVRPEERDGTSWSVKFSTRVDGAEIAETFTIDQPGTITYHDTLVEVDTDQLAGEEEVTVEIGQIDKLVSVLTDVQRVVNGHARTGEAVN